MAKNRNLASINGKLLRRSEILQNTITTLLETRRPLWVLEIGCGAGRALMELARQFKDAAVRFYGIYKKSGDPLASSADLLDTAQRYGLAPDEELRRLALPELFFYDATQLHFADASLDLVYSVEMFRFVERKAEFLEEVGRVLKPGGVALLQLSNAGWNYPHSLAQDNTALTPYNSRFVLKYGNELIPLEIYLRLFAGDGFTFEFINLPACVIKLDKLRPGKLALRLHYDNALSLSMKQLPYGDDSSGKAKGGFRSVYHLDADAYQALFEREWLSPDTLLSAAEVAQTHRPKARRTFDGNGLRPYEIDAAALPAAAQKDKKYGVQKLHPGQRVKVKGRRQSGPAFLSIKTRPNEDGETRDTFEGKIDWVDGAAAAFGLLGFRVYPEAACAIKGENDEDLSFADLAPGKLAKVKGRYTDGRIAAEKIKVKIAPSVVVEEMQG